MRIGVFLDARTDDPLGELTAGIRTAADDGLAAVWIPQIFGVDALTALAVAGREAGGDIELGTAVVPIQPRHPMMLAQQALTTQLATGGRLTLGIGLSHQLVVEHMWGLSFEKPAAHMREYLAALLPLLRERSVTFEGEHFRVSGGLTIKGETPNTPVLVAALAPRMLELAGTVADGTITWMTGPKTMGEHVVPTLQKAASSVGRDVRAVCALPVCVTDDADRARDLIARFFAHYGQLPSYRAMLDREAPGAGPADVAIVGDEAAVLAGIERVAEAGATDFVAVEAAVGDDAVRTRSLLKSLV